MNPAPVICFGQQPCGFFPRRFLYAKFATARRSATGSLQLHEGGNSFITLPDTPYTAAQISPSRDSRLRWMQSVIHCTHYIAGAGEQAYLNPSDAPEITFIARNTIDRSDEAYTDA